MWEAGGRQDTPGASRSPGGRRGPGLSKSVTLAEEASSPRLLREGLGGGRISEALDTLKGRRYVADVGCKQSGGSQDGQLSRGEDSPSRHSTLEDFGPGSRVGGACPIVPATPPILVIWVKVGAEKCGCGFLSPCGTVHP